jgi:hypothetical protein
MPDCAISNALQPWTELGTKILDTVNGLLSAEKVAFESLREEVSLYAWIITEPADFTSGQRKN